MAMGTEDRLRKEEKRFNFSDLAKLEDQLYEAEKSCGLEKPPAWWQKLGDRWFAWQDSRTRHLVRKKSYLLLTVFLGWMGIHRFYEKRWKLGLFYLLLCWTGFPVALAVGDFLIAVPLKADEEGLILI